MIKSIQTLSSALPYAIGSLIAWAIFSNLCQPTREKYLPFIILAFSAAKDLSKELFQTILSSRILPLVHKRVLGELLVDLQQRSAKKIPFPFIKDTLQKAYVACEQHPAIAAKILPFSEAMDKLSRQGATKYNRITIPTAARLATELQDILRGL